MKFVIAQPAQALSPAPSGAGRWSMLFLLFLAGVINYLDRAALPVLAPLVARDLRLDPAEMGMVFSGFAAGYAISCIIGGWAADRFKPHRVLLVSAAIWSVFCGLTAIARSFGAILVIRIAFGMGEGGLGATGTKLIGQWFPRPQQATALALAAAGTSAGGMVAGPLVVFVAVFAGWRGAFVAIAAIGLLWSLIWAVFNRFVPPRMPRESDDRADHAGMMNADISTPPLLKTLLQPAIIAVAAAFFGYSYILYFFLSWFPSYLLSEKYLSIQDMSLVSTIPWALGTIGLVSGGFISDWVFRRTGNPIFARKLILVTSLIIAACGVALVSVVTSAAAAVALMGIAVFFLYLSGSLYFVLVLDLVAPGHVGTVTGFVHFVANCAGILAPLITGFIVRSSGSFTSAFVLAGAIAILGTLGVGFLVRSR